MELDEQIRSGIKRLAEAVGPVATMLAKVISVDTEAKTCVLLETIGEDEIEIPEVRLRPVLNGKESITIYPKTGSYVLAVRIENDEQWMVLAVDEAERINYKTDNSEFEMSNGFLLKRGDDTLKAVLLNVIEACEVILVLQGNNPDYTKLATAKASLNNLLR